MKEAPTNSGKTYSVHTANGCTVSDDSGWSKTIDAPDGYFTAHGSSVHLSDDEATLREVFKLAPQQQLALLGVLGGNAGDNGGLPAGYTRLEYLESDGNQWINTEFTPTTSENFKADLVVLVKAGVRYAQGISCAFCRSFWVTPIHDGWRVSGYSANTTNHVPLDTKVKIELSPDFVSFLGKKLQISKLDTSAITEIPSDPEGLKPVKLFAYNDGASYAEEWLKGYIYEFQAQFADQKTHMIPALDERGAPCFYCLHRKITFYNQGAGDFLYPGKAAEVNTFSRRRTVTFAQLTAHGVRRLYRVPRGYNGTKEEYAAEHGFKPLVETPQPAEGCWAPVWRETTEEIVLDWVETEPPMDELGMPEEILTNN